MKRLLIFFLAAFFLLPNFAAAEEGTVANDKEQKAISAPDRLILTYERGVKKIEGAVKCGGTVQLRLRENPSTGFAWGFKHMDGSFFAIEGNEFFLPQNPKLMGASGLRVITLRALKAGDTTLELADYRASEGYDSAFEDFAAAVAIEE